MNEKDQENGVPPPYDVSSQQQYPQRHVQGQQSQQAYGQFQPGYQNYGQHQQPVVVAPPAPQTVFVNQPLSLQQRPANFLVPAIFVCLCCFWPTGICAIIAANNANKAADVGDLPYAQQQRKKARILVFVTMILEFVCIAVTVSVVLREYN